MLDKYTYLVLGVILGAAIVVYWWIGREQRIEFKNNCNGIPSKYKAYKDICEEYDYDDERELDILLLNFKEKYMNIEILEEYENELEGQ